MSVGYDVLNAVIDMAEATLPYAAIARGSLPTDNGISMTWAAGGPEMIFLGDKKAAYEQVAVLNGKHENQATLIQALDAIHETLTLAAVYPYSDNWQIYSIETMAAPSFLDREEGVNHQWLYGSSLRVKYFVR